MHIQLLDGRVLPVSKMVYKWDDYACPLPRRVFMPIDHRTLDQIEPDMLRPGTPILSYAAGAGWVGGWLQK